MSAIVVTRLFSWPVKGTLGCDVPQLTIGRCGPVDDRRFVITNAAGMFVTQRSQNGLGIAVPQLCFITARIVRGFLVLSAPGMLDLSVEIGWQDVSLRQVQIWSDTVPAYDQGEEASQWLTTFLSPYAKGPFRLHRLSDDSKRVGESGAPITFVDNEPLLVMSEATLNDLNWRIARRREAAGEPAIPAFDWPSFRPTIVIKGCHPYGEDFMYRLKASSGATFVNCGQCERCIFTCITQQDATRGHDPLRTLAAYRRNPDGKPVLGALFRPTHLGTLEVGDLLEL